MHVFQQKPLTQWLQSHPLLNPIIAHQELCWFNPKLRQFAEIVETLPLGTADIRDAADRLQRFAPYIVQAFPDTAENGGLIESPLVKIPTVQQALEALYGLSLPGSLMLKCDSHLPISGSIKARGGIYEVLKHAETLALDAGLLSLDDDYRVLATPACRDFFAEHSIVVGSTGNLGLSIGIMGAQLGFKVCVHMSADARQWKKDLLKSKGVIVVEHPDDYSKAVEQGRLEAQQTPRCHFIDDENSQDLFLGYSVAAQRLQQQLNQQGVIVDAEHPLFVYLPCGVGGGPGGVAFGLKQIFGDDVHCFFAEPTHSPCMLVGMYTGLHDQVSVQELGIDNKTCADGLAVGRPSAFVGRLMTPLLDGIYTLEDDSLYRLLALLKDSEDIALEPSALAGLPGMVKLLSEVGQPYLVQKGLADKLDQATHIAWATGGNMVPEQERSDYYATGKALLSALKA
ncbi:D-serine ammonia-lyase [Marinobacterium sediminicola]|uniref:Probable D-serine dehydratase n=1 Tax=Marinobacterium sediminicola TaxID=518898 RepID=A0ABY1S113_9GAMM|nr:D-serine ammonia-lyase [Marinobacterium sediminicola]ULG68312.1 D-serine ammonia-lyase [Marinobacterium sediminicola]SMR74831.1 D-serine ammonia-lyase [Marinobacterium sediminicola]